MLLSPSTVMGGSSNLIPTTNSRFCVSTRKREVGYRPSPADRSRSARQPCDARARFWLLTLVLLCVALLSGCHTQHSPHDPVVEFTKIAPAAQGGRERVDEVAGRVSRARPGQQIVVYARSGPWWVQPWPDK